MYIFLLSAKADPYVKQLSFKDNKSSLKIQQNSEKDQPIRLVLNAYVSV